MCWTTFKFPIKLIANKPKKVYKILRVRFDDFIASPCFSDMYWELNRVYTTHIRVHTNDGRRGYDISEGFHSLSDIPEVINSGFANVWVLNNNQIFRADFGEYVYECEIPKGSEYYENERGEIVSNKLKIIKKINC